MTSRRIVTAREQHELLSPWREAAFSSDVVDRLQGEFHDWWNAEGQHHPNARASVGVEVGRKFHERGPIGHWPNVERFLKRNYPAAHRNLALGYEQVADLLDVPELVSGRPYQTGPKALNKHGYDPKEIAAAMLLLHNQSDPDRKDVSDEDQERLNDIAQKRFQMQRNYEQRTGAINDWDHPTEGEGFDAWRNRLWDGVMGGKTFHPNAPGSHYRAMSNDEYQAGLSNGAFRPLIGDHMYVTDDPDRLAGGAYGAKNGGHIVEFDPQPTHDIPSRTIGDRLMEKGVTHIPLDAVRRVWSWNGTDHMPEVRRG